MADYVPTAAADLRLERGAVVAVADKPAHGWWEGWNSRGEFGRFPGNYVELTPAADGGGGGMALGRGGRWWRRTAGSDRRRWRG